jgi:hypothetical protein
LRARSGKGKGERSSPGIRNSTPPDPNPNPNADPRPLFHHTATPLTLLLISLNTSPALPQHPTPNTQHPTLRLRLRRPSLIAARAIPERLPRASLCLCLCLCLCLGLRLRPLPGPGTHRARRTDTMVPGLSHWTDGLEWAQSDCTKGMEGRRGAWSMEHGARGMGHGRQADEKEVTFRD